MEKQTLITAALLLSLLLPLSACDETSDSRIVIGRGDTIITTNDNAYIKPILVQVSNSNGAPQAGISVDISLRAISFTKGRFTFTEDPDLDGTPDLWEIATNAICNPEDANNNGRDDGGEDLNGNGTLDPALPTIIQHPSLLPTVGAGTATLVTDANGQGYFALSYPRSLANWVRIELLATAEDGLPENRGIDTFTLPIAISDIDDGTNDPPGGVVGPYGESASCNTTI